MSTKDFNEGDVVRILTEPWLGRTGVVDCVKDGLVHVEVRTGVTSGIVYIYPTNLSHEHASPKGRAYSDYKDGELFSGNPYPKDSKPYNEYNTEMQKFVSQELKDVYQSDKIGK